MRIASEACSTHEANSHENVAQGVTGRETDENVKQDRSSADKNLREVISAG